jgi:hypothetical protein
MNAPSLTKSARAFILASGLIAASTVLAAAQDVPVSLGAAATIPLSNFYVAPPTGQATLGGHTFNLSGGNLLQLTTNGMSQSYAGSYPNATAVYLLLNTFNTNFYYQGMPAGTVVLTFSDGTTQSATLTVGGNVREWRTGSGFTVNTVTDTLTTLPVYSTQVWTGSAQPAMGGGAAVIDMLTIKVATAGKTLTAVTVTFTNAFGGPLMLDLAGLTVDQVAPTPTPTPTPTCTPKHTNREDKVQTGKPLKHCDDADKSDAKADVEKDDQHTTAQRTDD